MLIPFDEILEVLLYEDAKPILDLGDVLRVCGASVWDLVILEALVSLIITRRTEAL